MSKTCTLSDVAGRLGLSTATVSRALAQHEQIAASTREKVARTAAEMGYVPNRAAQALASGRSGFVGFVLPMRGRGLADPFLGEFVSALTEGFGARGVDLIMSAVPRQGSELAQLGNLVTSGRVDGIVLSRVEEVDARIEMLQRRGVPFVTHGRQLGVTEGYSWLDTDGAAAFAEAFGLLHALGHRRFGLLTIDDPLTFRHVRDSGLRAAIAAAGDPTVSLRAVTCPRYDPQQRAAAIDRLLDGPDRPTAVLAVSDGLALDVLGQAAVRGLSVPSDLSVIGFDNIPAAELVAPGLTTFDAQIQDCAGQLARMLLTRIAAPDTPHEARLICPRLMLRGSHGPAPAPATSD